MLKLKKKRFERINNCFNAKTYEEFNNLVEVYSKDDSIFLSVRDLMPLMKLKGLEGAKEMMNDFQCSDKSNNQQEIKKTKRSK